MNSLFVKPVAGGIVRQPERANQPLQPHGAKVPRTTFWVRRLKDGSVEETTAEAIATAEAAIEKARAKAAAKAEADAKPSANNKGDK